MITSEIAPASRKDNKIQDIRSCIDKKDAVARNSLTSPAAMPFIKYTGRRIRRDIPMEHKVFMTPSIPWPMDNKSPAAIPGIIQAL